jgi:hypothetical protein
MAGVAAVGDDAEGRSARRLYGTQIVDLAALK